MATAEFVGANLGPMHPMHSVVGQPIIDMGLNGDTVDSRKRPLEGDIEGGVPKRSHTVGIISNGDDTKYMLKMLIPSTVAGSIIGKGGQTIAQLQKDTKTVIKLSKNNDFYPGTTERVALMTGTVEALNNVCSFIIDKLKESQQQVTKTGVETNLIPPDRARQVKVVVPNSTAGLIIGKAGAMIKHIMEQSGSRVQISQKSDGITLTERVITITGEGDPNKKALSFIVDKVQEDPQSGSCNNLSYATATFPVANSNPTGSPFADNAVAAVVPTSVVKAQIPVTPAGLAGLPASALHVGATGVSIPQQSYARVPTTLSYSTGDAAAINALNTLASYNYTIGGIPVPAGLAAHGSLFAGTPAHMQHAQVIPSGLLGTYQVAAVAGSPKTTPPSPLSLQCSVAESPILNGSPTFTVPSHHLQESTVPGMGVAAPIGSLTSMGAGLGAIALQQDSMPTQSIKDISRDTILEIDVPENLVGAILGKRGQTLVEFQTTSGAKIQISKKGEYVPGTRNRKVTITGAPNQAQLAHFFVTQKVAQEEQNRALKGTT